MVNEIYFIVVLHAVESIREYADTDNPRIWVAAATESYEDAETFQKMLCNTLQYPDIVVIVGANLLTGTGIVDIKASMENGSN